MKFCDICKSVLIFFLVIVLVIGLLPFGVIDAEASNDRPVLSVLGDSISSYYGYENDPYYGLSLGDSVKYVMNKDDMWWSVLSQNKDVTIGWSGAICASMVTAEDDSYFSLNNPRRIDNLRKNGEPDLIAIFGGVNDLVLAGADESMFYDKYNLLVFRLHIQYPNARLICIAPYELQNGDFPYDNRVIEQYANAIKTIADAYGDLYVDLREIKFDSSDFDRYGSLHPNESGQKKIARVIEEALDDVDILRVNTEVSCDRYIFSVQLIDNSLNDVNYRLEITDSVACRKETFDWQNSNRFEWFNINADGNYIIKAEIDNNQDGEPDDSYEINIGKPSLKTINTGVYVFSATSTNVTAGLCTDVDNKYDFDFQWLGYDLSQGTWFVISDWTQGNEWMNWKPKGFGNYWIYGRVKPHNSTVINGGTCIDYRHKCINGKCVMADYSRFGGVLMGFSTYDNNDNTYRYEVQVLDYDLFASGYSYPWVYSTGMMNTYGENSAWTVWNPYRHSNYYALFRVYDDSGRVLEEESYYFYV